MDEDLKLFQDVSPILLLLTICPVGSNDGDTTREGRISNSGGNVLLKLFKNEEGPQTEDTILVSLDVIALYPNVPQEEGLQALAEALREAGMDEKLIDFLIRCTRAVLT